MIILKTGSKGKQERKQVEIKSKKDRKLKNRSGRGLRMRFLKIWI